MGRVGGWKWDLTCWGQLWGSLSQSSLLPMPLPVGPLASKSMRSIPSAFGVRASLVAQLVKNLPAMRETWVQSLGLEDSPGEGKGYPVQYSGLENSMGSQRVRHD